MYRYYCILRPPSSEALPYLKTMYDSEAFYERHYIPEIDRMAWGWIECKEELTPQEIADYGLIMKPREE